MIKKNILIIILSLFSLFSVAQHFTPLKKLESAQRIIDAFYVDSIDSNHVVEEGIIAMLKTLDPHSVYSNADETRELNTPLQGNFSGIGIQFNMLTDSVYVIQTISGGPSEKVGIRAGDRIISANDTILAGKKLKNSTIMKHLRGPKGSDVKLKVLRNEEPEPLTFIVTRDNIPINSVEAAYMATPKIGYIKLTRFAETTPHEMANAIVKLQKQGMKDLIIDLEYNTGGYMEAATDVAEMFLNKGDLLVYTKGRALEPRYIKSQRKGGFNGKIAVLVNESSASASEILAGAIQDHDRGAVIGRRTFGKGLVQRPFNMPDGSMIRLTIARYYTPSGRCVQKPYTSGDDKDYSSDIINRYNHGEFVSADSIRHSSDMYYTIKNRRPVYGGGGIMPDLFVPIDTTGNTQYYRKIMAHGILNKYAQKYVDANRHIIKGSFPDDNSFVNNFTVSDDMLNDIVKLAENDSIKFNSDQFNESKQLLATIAKGLIGNNVYSDAVYNRVINPLLPAYNKAIGLLEDEKEYRNLLKPVDSVKNK